MEAQDKKKQYVIRNVVSTADLKQIIDISKFNNYPWGRFDVVNNYNGKVGYLKDPQMEGRVSVFTSGKLISTGAKSLKISEKQLQKTRDILFENNFIHYVSILVKIRNIVATSFIDNFDFNKFIKDHNLIYEPDQFAGAIYKSHQKTTISIFSSGKVIIVGSKDENQIINSIEEITNK